MKMRTKATCRECFEHGEASLDEECDDKEIYGGQMDARDGREPMEDQGGLKGAKEKAKPYWPADARGLTRIEHTQLIRVHQRLSAAQTVLPDFFGSFFSSRDLHPRARRRAAQGPTRLGRMRLARMASGSHRWYRDASSAQNFSLSDLCSAPRSMRTRPGTNSPETFAAGTNTAISSSRTRIT